MSESQRLPPDNYFQVVTHEIAKAKDALREETKSALAMQAELLVTGGIGRHEKALLRIDAVEKIHEIFKDDLNRVPTRLQMEADRITSLFDEKLNTINKLTEAYATSSGAAITKTEAAVTKEIDGINALIDTIKHAFEMQIGNLTDRMNRSEGVFAGGKGVVVFIVTVVAAAGIYIAQHNSIPTVGADTKRVDDLIAVMTEQNRQAGQRMDALSARLNALTPAPKN